MYYKHTAFSWGCYGRLPQEENISPETVLSSRVICFLLVLIYRNTLNQRQYVLYYTECPSAGGIAGCGISLQYHPLLWWAGLRKVREKYHIYIYQWNCRIIKEIWIKYNIIYSILVTQKLSHPFGIFLSVLVIWRYQRRNHVYRRRTDSTMAKRKKYKRTNNDLQNIHIKLKIE